MRARARLERIERRMPRPAAPPAPVRFIWPDGTGPHDGPPPVDLSLPNIRYTPPADGEPLPAPWRCSPDCPGCAGARPARSPVTERRPLA